MTPQSEIERYLQTGESDPLFMAWSGDVFARAQRAEHDLHRALWAEVQRRTAVAVPPRTDVGDPVALTRRKVEPMVRGLFPAREQALVLAMLEKSVVFLTPANIEAVLQAQRPHSAWALANLYLLSREAELLHEDAPRIVGLSEHTTCFVSLEYFEDDHPFADFVVHEAAHIFHNCKRRTVGLPATRRREWLLDIEFRKRETFAYACEAYSRVLAEAPRIADRPARIAAFAEDPIGADQTVDPAELLDILRDAAQARNGWKRILARCAPRPPGTGPAGALAP
jgi:hypothetical protein